MTLEVSAAIPARQIPTVGFLAPWSRMPAWERLCCLPLLLVLGAFAVRSFRDPFTADVGLAYQGGAVAWSTGHPESLSTWISTPFLAMVMAAVSHLTTEHRAALLMALLNFALTLGLLVVVWGRLRHRVPRYLWWLTLVAATVFAPLISTFGYKQFNLLALALALAGFELARTGQRCPSGALVALSLAVKPIVVLLPLSLLLWRDTRRAGIWALAWGVAILGVSQAFLALRAQDVRALSPLPALRSFSSKSSPLTNAWACHYLNYSPDSLMCRVVGHPETWIAQRVAVGLGMLLLLFIVLNVLRHEAGTRWKVFAFVCLLSPMVSPIAWSHYQLFLAPMLLLLASDFTTRRAEIVEWVALGAALVLAELVWEPYGTVAGWINSVLTGQAPDMSLEFTVNSVAAFAPFVLLLVALMRFSQLHPRASHLSAYAARKVS